MIQTNGAYDIRQSATLADITMCLNYYRLSTPGLYVCVNPQVQIDQDTRIVPSLIAQVNSGEFKQCETGREQGDYDHFIGPPNFIFDVFRKEQQDVYHSRRKLFEQNGVIEYVVWFMLETLPVWNRLVDGQYQEIDEDEEGLIKSQALPGLWVPTKSLVERDMWSIMAKIAHGTTRRGHRDFMATIWQK